MKTVLILGILLLAANAGFNINTDACQAEKYDNWDAVRFPVQGGSGDFEFNFEKLPQGWYANKDRVYIPKGKVQKNKYYSTKVTVFDKKDKQYLKRSLLLNYDNDNKFGRVFDADYDVDFDDRNNLDQFLNSRGRGNFAFNSNNYDRNQVVINQRSEAGSNVVTRTDYYIPSQPAPNQVIPNFEPRRDQYVPNQVVPNQVIPSQVVVPNYRPEVVVPNYRPDQVIVPNYRPDPVIRPNVDDDRRRNPYYDSFPGDDEIERVITNVDCSRIRDIINFVSQSGFGCKSRAQYLQKFQNKLQIKIAIFRTDAEKNRQPIFGLQEQLKALKEQLEKINARPDRDSQSERVRGYRSEIERHERERAGYQNEYRNSKDSVERLRNEISGIRSSSSECRNGYDQQDRRIRQIESKIAQLEDKLRDLKNEKEQCRGRRDKHQNGVADSDRRIDQCNNKIKFHQDIIDGYEKKSRYCTDAINEFNKKIEDCNRQHENNGRENAKDIKAKIDAIEDQIANNNRQADRLVRLFTEYEKYQNQFEGLVNKHYYGCYQYTPVQDNDHRDDKFTAPSSAFVSYMKDVFGQAPNENIRARFSGSVNIRKNTIFSPAWTKVYGIPFSAGYGNNKDISEDNFSCIESSPEKLKVFSGRIEEITKNVIQVQSRTGDRYTVHLGGCTRIQSITEKQLPEKGSQIYFKGYERSEKNHYNGYHVTCY